MYLSQTLCDTYVFDMCVAARQLTWDEAHLHENKSKTTSRQDNQRRENLADGGPGQTSDIMSQDKMSIINGNNELAFDTEILSGDYQLRQFKS